jgi:hypothetical protein
MRTEDRRQRGYYISQTATKFDELVTPISLRDFSSPSSLSDTICLAGKNIMFPVSNGRRDTWIKDSPTDLKNVEFSP